MLWMMLHQTYFIFISFVRHILYSVFVCRKSVHKGARSLPICRMEFMSDDGDNVCPLCMEEMDLTDRQLKPCKCGYEICVWCWHHVMEMAEKDNTEGRCPACRTPYDKEKIVGMTVSCERLTDINIEKRQKSQKAKAKASEGRKHLSNVRVIQRNLVYIVGIPSNLAEEEILERREFFGQYGKILKVSISRSSTSAQHSANGPTSSVYITYVKEEEAIRCIQAVNGFVLDGRPLRACFGTTKYCHAWLKNMPCNNPDCLYLHDVGSQEDSFTKEEMASACASKIQQFHAVTCPPQRRSGNCLPSPAVDASSANLAASSKPASNSGGQDRTTIVNGTAAKSTVLPVAASWGIRVAQGRTLPAKMSTVLGSTKLKSSTSHTLSVSPPNIPTSAAIVAAAAVRPEVHSDQGKPSLFATGGHTAQSSERLPCFVSAKQNAVKNNPLIGTDKTQTTAVDASVTIAASETVSSRQVSPVRKCSRNVPCPKAGIHDGLEKASYDCQQNSDLSSGPHIEQAIESEGSGHMSVFSGGVDGKHCQDDPLRTAAYNHYQVSTPARKDCTEAIDTDAHATDLFSEVSTSCVDLTQTSANSSLETFMVESMKGISMTRSEDLSLSNQLEKRFSDSFVQKQETGRETSHGFTFSDYKKCFDSLVSTNEAEVCSPGGVLTSADCSNAVSFNDSDLSTISQLQPLDYNIVNADTSKTGINYHRVERTVCSSSTYSNKGSAHTTIYGSDTAKGDECPRISGQDREQFAICEASDSQYKVGESECLGKPQNCIDTDAGERSIISNILSMNFDLFENNSVASPHNLAKMLLDEKDIISGLSKDMASPWKSHNSSQSRFLFARQEDSTTGSLHYSKSFSASNGKLQKTCSNGRDVLDSKNGNDQWNKSLNNVTSCNQEESHILNDDGTSYSLPDPMVTPNSVPRSQFAAPPGFSVPPRTRPVPPPGFSSQLRVDRPSESTASAVFPNGNQVLNNSLSLQDIYLNTYNQHQTLGNISSNDVEFIDPAIMAVGRGKLQMGLSQPGSAGHEPVHNVPRQDSSNSKLGQSLLGLRAAFSQQVSPRDYDARFQMFKQRAAYYANSNLVASRQQLKFPDHVEDSFASYLPRQNESTIPPSMMQQTQANFDSPFSQMSYKQPVSSTLRSSAAGAYGWDGWNRMSSAIESGLVGRRLDASLLEIANNERRGLFDPNVGLSKIFPCYEDPRFQISSSDGLYSRTFGM